MSLKDSFPILILRFNAIVGAILISDYGVIFRSEAENLCWPREMQFSTGLCRTKISSAYGSNTNTPKARDITD